MANLCGIYTIAGLTMNAASGNTYITDSIEGLDGASIRRTVENRPQTDGGILFPAFLAPRHVIFEGFMLVRSADPFRQRSAYESALNALESSMVSALDSIINSDGTLSWNGGGDTLSVRRDEQPTSFRGKWPEKRFLFTLIAANPVIS
jgi:hypothetical protein